MVLSGPSDMQAGLRPRTASSSESARRTDMLYLDWRSGNVSSYEWMNGAGEYLDIRSNNGNNSTTYMSAVGEAAGVQADLSSTLRTLAGSEEVLVEVSKMQVREALLHLPQ